MSFEQKAFQDPAENKQEQEIEVREKLMRIDEIRKKVEEFADFQGKGLDDGIKESIVSLSVMDIPTSASCEGHPWKGSKSAPWVEIGDIEEPEERFVDQNKVTQEVADERGLTFEEVKRSYNPDAYWEMQRRVVENEETEEYKAWEVKNRKTFAKVKDLVEEFYRQKGEPKNSEAKIICDDDWRQIHNGGRDYVILENDLSAEQKTVTEQRIKEYQEEFKRFADFLLEKYLQG